MYYGDDTNPETDITIDPTVVPPADAVVDVSQIPEPKEEIDQKESANKARRPSRNYSFLSKNPDKLDRVEVNGIEFIIPASIGSCYWAILKVCYENADKPVYLDRLVSSVAEFMQDRDEDAWQRYITKNKTTVYKKVGGERVVQPVKPWQERVVNNAKTLTRLGGESQYGKRLHERGHCLRYEHDDKMQPYVILHTNLAVLSQKKKTAEDDQPKA
jgi:DNA-binding NtrC family response regulator